MYRNEESKGQTARWVSEKVRLSETPLHWKDRRESESQSRAQVFLDLSRDSQQLNKAPFVSGYGQLMDRTTTLPRQPLTVLILSCSTSLSFYSKVSGFVD